MLFVSERRKDEETMEGKHRGTEGRKMKGRGGESKWGKRGECLGVL